jgi:hypothetical protein
MWTLTERMASRFTEDAGFLSSNLRSEDTGIEGAVIWFFAGEFDRKETQHGPRILICLGEEVTIESLADSVGVRLTSPPDVLGTLPSTITRQVVAFVEANRDVLLRYWQGETATSEVLELLVRVIRARV